MITAGGSATIKMLSGDATKATASDPLGTARHGWGATSSRTPPGPRTPTSRRPAGTTTAALPDDVRLRHPHRLVGADRALPAGPVRPLDDLHGQDDGGGVERPHRRPLRLRQQPGLPVLPFTATSNDVWLEVRSGSTVVGSFLRVAESTTVARGVRVHLGRPASGTEDAYITMATAAASRGIWVSPGSTPTGDARQRLGGASSSSTWATWRSSTTGTRTRTRTTPTTTPPQLSSRSTRRWPGARPT